MEFKSDQSPVTEADRAAEAAIRAILEKERPQDGIIGEEYGAVREDAERVWILDPIDGTRSFIAGRPIFGTLIALTQAGWPTVGIIDQPIAGERWAGMMGQPTTFNGKPVTTRPCRALEEAILASTAPQLFPGCTGEHFPGWRDNAGTRSGAGIAIITDWSRPAMSISWSKRASNCTTWPHWCRWSRARAGACATGLASP